MGALVAPYPWHSRAGGGAVHSITTGSEQMQQRRIGQLRPAQNPVDELSGAPESAEVNEGRRADGGREFLFLVADIPDADYFARCVLDRVITGHVQFAEDKVLMRRRWVNRSGSAKIYSASAWPLSLSKTGPISS